MIDTHRIGIVSNDQALKHEGLSVVSEECSLGVLDTSKKFTFRVIDHYGSPAQTKCEFASTDLDLFSRASVGAHGLEKR